MTEILRNMFCKCADLICDVGISILDECRYVSDHERGFVPEEIMIVIILHLYAVIV